jgi:hypothetical protein
MYKAAGKILHVAGGLQGQPDFELAADGPVPAAVILAGEIRPNQKGDNLEGAHVRVC